MLKVGGRFEFKVGEKISKRGKEKRTMKEILEQAEAAGMMSFTERIPNRPNHTSTVVVGEGEGRKTREFQQIWVTELFKSVKAGKLRLLFFVKLKFHPAVSLL